MDENTERVLALPMPLLTALANYLVTRPYNEVFQLIAALSKLQDVPTGTGVPTEEK